MSDSTDSVLEKVIAIAQEVETMWIARPDDESSMTMLIANEGIWRALAVVAAAVDGAGTEIGEDDQFRPLLIEVDGADDHVKRDERGAHKV